MRSTFWPNRIFERQSSQNRHTGLKFSPKRENSALSMKIVQDALARMAKNGQNGLILSKAAQNNSFGQNNLILAKDIQNYGIWPKWTSLPVWLNRTGLLFSRFIILTSLGPVSHFDLFGSVCHFDLSGAVCHFDSFGLICHFALFGPDWCFDSIGMIFLI